jgi:ComF family protein
MIDILLSLIAPHLCFGCGKNGTLLCHNCKYDIINQDFMSCIGCGRSTSSTICSICHLPYEKAWCVGERSGSLEALINNYKFENARAAHLSLADLLHTTLPILPPEVIIVPVPTVSSHIRQRGYDHTWLVAARLAKLRGHTVQSLIERQTSTKQRGVNRRQRMKQAKEAFTVRKLINPTLPYLLVDDVVTTGATLHYAARALRDAGATIVWVAVVARQPLD